MKKNVKSTIGNLAINLGKHAVPVKTLDVPINHYATVVLHLLSLFYLVSIY